MDDMNSEFLMEYKDVGGGAPLLLIHGFPLTSELWEPQIHAFDGGKQRVIAPDLRGFGASQPLPGPYSMDMLARDCARLLDQLKVDQKVVVGGLSMGGYVAFAFYRLFPERVAGLILAATRAGADPEAAKAKRAENAALAQKEGVRPIAEQMLPKMMSPKTYESNPKLVSFVRVMMESCSVEGVAGVLLAMKDRPDSTPTLAQIHVPALILHGEDDQLIPPSEALVMQAGIQGAQLKLIPEAGHLLNLEQPEAFNQAVREFLMKVSGSPK